MVLFLGLQAFKEAWEMACSFRARTRIVIPAGYNFLVYPVDFGGPCKSKVTLDVSITAKLFCCDLHNFFILSEYSSPISYCIGIVI